MCGLCGVFGEEGHWTDALDHQGGTPLAARLQHCDAVSRVLSHFGVSLRPWGGRYILSNRTGRSIVLNHIGALWTAVESLSGQTCDPLDPNLIGLVLANTPERNHGNSR